MTKRIFYIFISSLTLTCCNDTTKVQLNTRTSGDTTTIITAKKDSITLNKPTFDFVKFTHLTDSLLKSIASKTINIVCHVNTLELKKDSSGHPLMVILSSENVIVTGYYFDAGKGNPYLDFKVVEARFTDSISAIKTYTRISKNASEDGSEGDHSPGLTYTNDFVIKNAKNIYWLNTACAYPPRNHAKLESFLLQCLTIKNITDSIHCDCGAGKCDVSGLKGSH